MLTTTDSHQREWIRPKILEELEIGKEASSIFGINENIKQFDICALLHVLENLGFPLDKILFKGANTLSSPSAFCKEISLTTDGVILTLNYGLLMGSSPLPNYFREAFENGKINEEKFVSFLQFFNHFLIKNFIKMNWIEKCFFKNWKKLHERHFHILGIDSVASMHWMMELFFPDLKIKVEKSLKKRKHKTLGFQIGKSILGGKYALGNFISNMTPSYVITLKADSEQTDMRTFWPAEIRKRLNESILPLIKKNRIYLSLYLTIDQYYRASHLSSHCHLGYTSLGNATKEFKWLLYEG